MYGCAYSKNQLVARDGDFDLADQAMAVMGLPMWKDAITLYSGDETAAS